MASFWFLYVLHFRRAPPGFSWGPAKPGFLGLSYPSRGLGWHSRWAPPGLSWGPAASGFGLRRVLPMGGAVYSDPELYCGRASIYSVCVSVCACAFAAVVLACPRGSSSRGVGRSTPVRRWPRGTSYQGVRILIMINS